MKSKVFKEHQWRFGPEGEVGIRNLAVDELKRMRDSWEEDMQRLFLSVSVDIREAIIGEYLKYCVKANLNASRAVVRLRKRASIGRTAK